MTENKGLVPADYQQQVSRLLQEKKSPVVYINGIKTLAISSKQGYKPYVQVDERLRILHEQVAAGKATYEMLFSDAKSIGSYYYWQVQIKISGQLFIGNATLKTEGAAPGSADEKAPGENAETSAMGRALGFAGFGTIEGLASYDEMERVGLANVSPVVESKNIPSEKTSYTVPPASSMQIEKVRSRWKKQGHNWEDVLKRAKFVNGDGSIFTDEELSERQVTFLAEKVIVLEDRKEQEAAVNNG